MQKQSQQLFKVTEEKFKQNWSPRKNHKTLWARNTRSQQGKTFPTKFSSPSRGETQLQFSPVLVASLGFSRDGLSISAKESSAPVCSAGSSPSRRYTSRKLQSSGTDFNCLLAVCVLWFPLELCCFRGFVDRFIAEVDCGKLPGHFFMFTFGCISGKQSF